MTSAMNTTKAEGCVDYLRVLTSMEHIPSVFTLKMGRAWAAQPLPSWVTLGPLRQCYENAGLLCIGNPGLTYVEGYAQPPGLPPVHHAWCIDMDGRVIDNTFRDCSSSQYFGVPIRAETLRALVEKTGRWGLFAEMMTPELLLNAVDEVQAGAYAVDPVDAASVRELILKHR